MSKSDQIRLRVSRSIDIPDRLKISRYARAPELGPRLLFFSGGSALQGLSRRLKAFTHNSIHLMTPFDSGGSSAALRETFGMPSVGDIRQRLMALADESVLGSPQVYRLFSHRLSTDESNKHLRKQLEQMAEGDDERIRSIPSPVQELIAAQLPSLLAALPVEFELKGASVGNLILAGGYIANGNDLDATLFLFSKLVNVHGTVRAIVNDNVHLGARLEDGQTVVGQHLLTGKEHPAIASPIQSIFLNRGLDRTDPVQLPLQPKNANLIGSAELICFGQGSFFSSLMANLLPEGVGRAVAANGCPKVLIPNLGVDPEQLGMDFDRMITQLLAQLQQDDESAHPGDLLNYVLVDSGRGNYPFAISPEVFDRLGIERIELPLVSKKSAPYYDDARVLEALLSLV
ncbi:MAG: GAK system CofD-like protein [Luminiphilus sp.]|nr:GAK system CofD-like protein [Luminiphilus sp.]